MPSAQSFCHINDLILGVKLMIFKSPPHSREGDRTREKVMRGGLGLLPHHRGRRWNAVRRYLERISWPW